VTDPVTDTPGAVAETETPGTTIDNSGRPVVERLRGSRLVRDNLGVAAGTGLSRITGVARFAALYFAAGPALRDAYVLANNTPNIIYELLLGGILTTTLVPLFTDQLMHDDDEATSAVVSVAIVCLGALTLLTLVAGPLLILLYGTNPGKGVAASDFRQVGITLALLFAPQVFFYGLMALGTALLNARRHFIAAAWAPVLNNVVVIAILVAVGAANIGGDEPLSKVRHHHSLLLLLGLGTTAGIVAMSVALLPPLRRAGVRIHFRPDWRHPGVRRALVLSGWTIGYVIANQIAAQTVAVLAKPGSGNVTNYNVAFMFFQLPHGLLAVSLMTTFQPDLARAAVHRDWSTFNTRLLLGLRLLYLVVVPAAIGYLVLTLSVGGAAQASGELSSGAALPVARILGGFALGLIGFSTYLFVLTAFYAMQDTRTPFFLNCVENVINIVLAVILVRHFGVVGLAVSYAVAYTIAAAMALTVLLRRNAGFDVGGLLRSIGKVVTAGVLMAAAVLAVVALLPTATAVQLAIAAGVAIVVGVLAYGGSVMALGVPGTLGMAWPRRAAGTEPNP
jgi:putative peptidoglycan lipid II flippase